MDHENAAVRAALSHQRRHVLGIPADTWRVTPDVPAQAVLGRQFLSLGLIVVRCVVAGERQHAPQFGLGPQPQIGLGPRVVGPRADRAHSGSGR